MQAQERATTYAQAAEAAPIVGMGGNHAQPGQVQLARVRRMPWLVEPFIKLKPPRFPDCVVTLKQRQNGWWNWSGLLRFWGAMMKRK